MSRALVGLTLGAILALIVRIGQIMTVVASVDARVAKLERYTAAPACRHQNQRASSSRWFCCLRQGHRGDHLYAEAPDR